MSTDLSRRSFLALTGASAIVAATASLIALEPTIAARSLTLWGDGIHDDTEALNTFLRGEMVEFAPGLPLPQAGFEGPVLRNGIFRISKPIVLTRSKTMLADNMFIGADGHNPGVFNMLNVRGPLRDCQILRNHFIGGEHKRVWPIQFGEPGLSAADRERKMREDMRARRGLCVTCGSPACVSGLGVRERQCEACIALDQGVSSGPGLKIWS